MNDTHSGSARIFLSSTFRDFGEERDLLVRRVFPALRARLRERFVELVDVDLRWGITVEAAERGDVLAICLAEIDRSRPWFVGMLGDRYGWVPPADGYDVALIEQQPWLAQHQGGKSVTELEILHGVLNDPAMAGRAFFYFRDAAYAKAKGGDYLSASDEDGARLKYLKDRIRASGFPVVEDYSTPEALAQRLEAQLWAVLDEAYPLEDVPDAFEQEQRQHEAYAIPRRRLYLGGERYITALDAAIAGGAQRILVEGQSGGGKSALMANWLAGHASANPANQIHSYYLGATANATAPDALVRHLVERIKRKTDSQDEIPSDPQALYDSLPTWLACASAHADMHDYRWVVVLDALNNLRDMRDLRWLPSFLPERVNIVVSCLPGDVREALSGKGDWQAILVEPLSADERQTLLRKFLSHYNKTLAPDLEARALAHPLAANPLFLRTLAEELRLFGSHEELSDILDLYLTSITVDDLFERVLARVEQDCGVEPVRTAMEAIWASRAGLAEEEILEFTKLVPATWAPIRLALEGSLMESGGRITFAHDYMRIAVSDRYMAGNNEPGDEKQSEQGRMLLRKAHEKLAKWFAKRPVDARTAEELPWQWQQARNWKMLKACLTKREMFEVMRNRHDKELLGYWIAIEAATETRIETAYGKALEGWDIDVLEGEDPTKASQVLYKLANFLFEAGRYFEPATSAANRALDCWYKGNQGVHAFAMIVRTLAQLLAISGKHDEAEAILRISLEACENKLDDKNPETAAVLNDLAALLDQNGKSEEAERLYRRALEINEKARSSEHRETATCLNNLAVLVHNEGDLDEAERLYRRSLAITDKAQGTDHPGSVSALNNLAMLLNEKRKLDEAERLYRRALTICEKILGPDHPDTATTLHNLAMPLAGQGKLDEAETICRRALGIREKAIGPEHSETARTLYNLAILLHDTGWPDEAEQLYRRALAIREKALSPDHLDIAASLENLALLLEQKGELDEAETLYCRGLAIEEKILGPDSPTTARTRNRLDRLIHDKALAATSHTRLIEDGKFKELVSIAKQIARHSGKAELSLLLIAYALVVWNNDDLPDASREKLESLARGVAITMGPSDDKPSNDKMPLDDELREMIAQHKSSTFAEFVTAILAATVV
jgi:nephrocystin-3